MNTDPIIDHIDDLPNKLYRIGSNYRVEEWTVLTGHPTDDGDWLFYLERKADYGIVHSREKQSKFQECETASFDRDRLEPEVQRRRELYEVKEGQIACAYCRKAVDEKKAYAYAVISIANYGRAGKRKRYCDRKCAGYDQMAHEG